MRRAELAGLGIQLPVLPTIVRGALPGPPAWAPRLERLGLDVISSGAAADGPDTWSAAAAAAPHRPAKAVPGDAVALVAAGCRLIEADAGVPPGAYRLSAGDAMVAPVAPGVPVEDPNDVAVAVLAAARGGEAASLWVVAGPGLDALSDPVVEAKLRALVEGTRLARLWLLKEQFDRD